MGKISYGVIKSVSPGEVSVSVNDSIIKISVDAETEHLVKEVLVDGLHIVAVDVEKEQLVFDNLSSEEQLSCLEGIE